MSDTLSVSNALSRSSLLEQIAHPTLVNPLAAQTSAATAAEQVWRVREAQARQAAGLAAQGAIGSDGTFDPSKANQNLVAAGPDAALASQEMIRNNQALRGSQIDQAVKVRGQIADMLAPLADPNLTPEQLHAGMVNVANQALDSGLPRGPVLSTLLNIPTDPDGRRMAIEQIRRSLLPPGELQTVTHGQIGTEMGPGGVRVGTVQNRQTGAYTQAPGGVQAGPSPDTLTTETPVYKRAPDGTYYRVPEQRADRPLPPGMGAPSAAPGSSAPGGGASPPAPPKPGTKMPGAYQPRDAAQPTSQPASASPPAQPPGAPAPSLSEPPQGQLDRLTAGNKLYTEASAAIPDQQRRLVAGESALEAMKLAATGPSTGYVAQAKAWLEARGETPDGTDGLSPAAARQVLQKQLLRFAQDSAKRSGTDLGLETQLHSNANADVMLSSANRHVLLQDIGMQRRDMAMNKMMPQGEAALDHVKNFPTDTDPRAFAFDVMTKEERNAVRADAARTKGGAEKLNRSLEIAHQLNLIKLPSAGQ